MARYLKIPITDHGTSCSNGYYVRYKPSASMNWISLQGLQQVQGEIISPSPLTIEYSLYISPLSDSTQYDIEVTRECCDGTAGIPTTDTYTTGS